MVVVEEGRLGALGLEGALSWVEVVEKGLLLEVY